MSRDRGKTVFRGNRKYSFKFDRPSSSVLERHSALKTSNVRKYGDSQDQTSSIISHDSMSLGSVSLESLKASQRGGEEDNEERRKSREEKKRHKKKKREKKERRERVKEEGKGSKVLRGDESLDSPTVRSGGSMDSDRAAGKAASEGGVEADDEERRRQHEGKKTRKEEKKKKKVRRESERAHVKEGRCKEEGKGSRDLRDDESLGSVTVGSKYMDSDGALVKAASEGRGEVNDEESLRRQEEKKRRHEEKKRCMREERKKKERRERGQASIIMEGVREGGGKGPKDSRDSGDNLKASFKSLDSMTEGTGSMDSDRALRRAASNSEGEADNEERRRRHEDKKRRHEEKKRRKREEREKRERRERDQAHIIVEGGRMEEGKGSRDTRDDLSASLESLDSMTVGSGSVDSDRALGRASSNSEGEAVKDERLRHRKEKKRRKREKKKRMERGQAHVITEGGREEEGKDSNDSRDSIAASLKSQDSMTVGSGSMDSDRPMTVESGSVDSDRAVGRAESDSWGEDDEERGRRHEEKKRRKKEKSERRERGRVHPVREDAEEEEGKGSKDSRDALAASLKSVDSAGSMTVGSGGSMDSDRVLGGSRGGGLDDEGEMDDEERRRRREEKKRRKRKKKEKKERKEIMQIMKTQSEHSSMRVQFVGLPPNIGQNPPAAGAMDATTKTDETVNFRRSTFTTGDSSYSLADISKTSTIASENYSNKDYLAYASKSKFKKGVKAKEKGKYELAKSKFRQALKARILLHEDIHHMSIAPVHEMIGMMDRELGDYEAATLGLMASLEIREAALCKLEGGAGEEGKDADEEEKKRQKLTESIERVKKAIEETEALDKPRREKAAEGRRKAAEEATEERRKAAEAEGKERRKNAKDDEDASAIQAAGSSAAGKKKMKRYLSSSVRASSSFVAGSNSGGLATSTHQKFIDKGQTENWNKVRKKMPSIKFVTGATKSKPKEDAARPRERRMSLASEPRERRMSLASEPKERRMSLASEPRERRMSLASETRNHIKYLTQVAKGEQYYAEGQYPMAIASFNNANLALLLVAGGRRGGGSPLDDFVAGLSNKINTARLSERIVDCRVEQRVSGDHPEITSEADDFSYVTYDGAIAILMGVRKDLSEQVGQLEEARLRDDSHEEYEVASANSPEEEEDALSNFKDLAKEVARSLAKIYSKQGCVFAKLGHPHAALDSFAGSIASWVEAAEEKEQNQTPERIFIEDDPLILKTQKTISSFTKFSGTEKNMQSAYILKNTTHLEALGTALQMAISHHHLGFEAMPENATRGMEKGNCHQLETATYHHLQALKLASETQKLRASFDVTNEAYSYEGTWELDGGEDTFIGAAMSVISKGGRECVLLKTLEQVCISHASFGLGQYALSKIWLLKAIAGMDGPCLSNAKEEARSIMHLLFTMTRKDKDNMASRGIFPIYQGSMAAAGYIEEPGLTFHSAIAALEKGVYAAQSAVSALEKGMYVDAISKLNSVTAAEVCKSPRPPGDRDEVLYAIDAKIILKAAQGDMAGMHDEMTRRMDVVSRWIGNPSVELAREMYRIACVESLVGNHENCEWRLDQLLQLASDWSEELNKLDLMKLRAVTRDALSDIDGALSEYESVLAAEESLLNKARLINAMANIHLKSGGQSHLAVLSIEKSLRIQEDFIKKEGRGDADLLSETKILYGNAMASNKLLAKAIQWYDSALVSSPEKSPVHPSNLRALYNKGVSLFRSGDIAGADEAFGTILEEAGRTSKFGNGTALVLNAIGSIYFANKDYDLAIQQFRESLILKNDKLSPSQRAGTLCNIATAYYKIGELEDSAASFSDALREAESAADGCSQMKPMIMSKFGHIMYRSKLYVCAHTLFTEAASMGSKEDQGDGLSHRCDRYAEMCRLKLSKQNLNERLPKQKPEICAMKPRFEASLIPITDGHNATRYSNAVFSPGRRMLVALGVEATMTLPSRDTKIACNVALQCLLKKVKDYRANHDDRLNSNFINLKSLLRNELKLIGDK